MATDISKTSGDWNSASTWSDDVPDEVSTVKIKAHDVVTLDQGSAIVGDLTVADRAILDIADESLTTTSDLTDNGDIIGSGEIVGSLYGIRKRRPAQPPRPCRSALYPEGKSLAEVPYARAKGARQVPIRIRVALADRARRLGLLTADVA